MQHCIRASLPYKNRTKLQKKHGKIKEKRLFFLTKEEKTIINIIVGRGVQNRRSI